MALTVQALGPSALELSVEGKLESDDYEQFIPLAEQCINANGKIGLLVNVSKFSGWSPAALWQDLKFDIKHYRDVSRLAMVGEDPSKRWMATLSKPFTAAEVKFFLGVEIAAAREWVQEARAE